jgi:hypothetical protein
VIQACKIKLSNQKTHYLKNNKIFLEIQPFKNKFNNNFVYYTKSHFKLFVWIINKKFVQNVQFLDSIKVINLKVFNK